MPFSCSISSLLPSSSLQSVMVPHTCIMHILALLAMEGNTLWHMMHTERIEDLGAGLAAHFQLDGYPAFVACFLSLILASFSPTVYLLAGLFFCVLTQCITPCLSVGWSSDSFSSILGFISSVSEPMSQPFSLHTPLSIWLLFHSFPCFTCQAQLDSVWPLFLLKPICFLPFTLSSCYHFLMSTTHCSTYCAIITSCQKCDFVLKLCVT